MKKELSKLTDIENELDLHKTWIEQSIKNTTEDFDMKKYIYVTKEDLKEVISNDNNVIILNAPLNVTRIKIQVNDTYNLKVYSNTSPIHAKLLNDLDETSNESEINTSNRKRPAENSSNNRSEKRRKLTGVEDDPELITAEILFRKLPNLEYESDYNRHSFLPLNPHLYKIDYTCVLYENEGINDLFDDNSIST